MYTYSSSIYNYDSFVIVKYNNVLLYLTFFISWNSITTFPLTISNIALAAFLSINFLFPSLMADNPEEHIAENVSDDSDFPDEPITRPLRPLNIISRREWKAQLTKGEYVEWLPVPYVVLEHNTGVESCFTRADCEAAMRSIQEKHMTELNEPDIQYK